MVPKGPRVAGEERVLGGADVDGYVGRRSPVRGQLDPDGVVVVDVGKPSRQHPGHALLRPHGLKGDRALQSYVTLSTNF